LSFPTTTMTMSPPASHHSNQIMDSTCPMAMYPLLKNVCQKFKNTSRISCQFDKHVRMNLDWKIGDGVWLNSCNITTTRPLW
ncbi:uncharacterized protein VP01_12812g1, partial [Puccinia sorghi]